MNMITTIVRTGEAARTVIGENTGTALAAANRAETAADRAELAEAAAEALVGPTYADTTAGLAATTEGGSFAVDNGDGTVTIYREVAGAAVEQRTLATTDYLASEDGGDAIGYQHPATGAAVHTIRKFLNGLPVPTEAFRHTGWDDTDTINYAIDSGESFLVGPREYNYEPSAKQLNFAQGIIGVGHIASKINKVADGDMFFLHAGCLIRDIGFQGNGSSGATGRGFVIDGLHSNITLDNLNVLDMDGYALEVTANNGGSQLRVIGGLWDRTDPALPAIKYASADTDATPRFLLGSVSTGVLVDLAGADNPSVIGGFTRNILFGSSKKAIVSGTRIATMGATLSITGTDNSVTGCPIAGDVEFGAGASNCTFSASPVAGGDSFADNSGNASNRTDYRFSGSSAYNPPSIPDGGAETLAVACPGARMGMIPSASFSLDTQGVILAPRISADDVVSVRFQNETGGIVDLGSGTLRVEARP